MMLGLALSPCATRPAGGVAAFDPATLSPTGRWQADYPGTTNWPDTGSVNDTLEELTGNEAVAGAAVNGHIPGDFDGTSMRMNSTSSLATFAPNAGGTVAILFNADAAAAAAGLAYNDPALLSSAAAVRFCLVFNSSGIRAMIYDGVGFPTTAHIACATGGWHWAFSWWDADTLYISLDDGAATSVALDGAGNPTLDAFVLRMGGNYTAAAFFNGKVLEAMAFGSVLSADDRANIVSYGAAEYGI